MVNSSEINFVVFFFVSEQGNSALVLVFMCPKYIPHFISFSSSVKRFLLIKMGKLHELTRALLLSTFFIFVSIIIRNKCQKFNPTLTFCVILQIRFCTFLFFVELHTGWVGRFSGEHFGVIPKSFKSSH